MKKVRVCPECGVPKQVAKENRWQDNGSILTFEANGETARERSAFYEVAGLNGLFANIEASIGKSIFRIIMEARRKDTLGILQEYLSGIKGVLARSVAARMVYNGVATLGATFGLGRFEVRDIKRGEYFTVLCRNVYSLPLLAGDLAAAFNAVEGLPASVDFKEAGDSLLCTISRGEEADTALSSRLEPVFVAPKPGSIRFDRCGRCGTPLFMKEVVFDHEEGVITDSRTGRRMTFLSTSNLEAIFREFELELGEEIIPMILEAQKDCAKSILQREELASESDVRDFLAVRGLGELAGYDLGERRLEAKVENAYPHLMVVGLLHGMFEILTGREGKSSFVREEDGSLAVTVEAA
ncbi:MAG: hypothetical protein H5T74_05980 [Actinobacteria bacterium]|nr:hypothetical protein [Actinomycetota bacterium]